MKCEICHEADAAAVIHVKKDGEDKELFVCKSCAAKARHAPKKKTSDEKGEPMLTFGGDEEPPEFVKNLVEATLGFMKGVAESGKRTHTKCPACKTTWEQIKKSGRLGCPHCWKVFAKSIHETFIAGEYGPNILHSSRQTSLPAAPSAFIGTTRTASSAMTTSTSLQRHGRCPPTSQTHTRASKPPSAGLPPTTSSPGTQSSATCHLSLNIAAPAFTYGPSSISKVSTSSATFRLSAPAWRPCG